MRSEITALLFMSTMLAGCSNQATITPVTTGGNRVKPEPFHPPTAMTDGAVDLASARRATQQRPGSGSARFDLGMAYYRAGRYQDAIPELRSAIRIGPRPPVYAYPYLAYSLRAVGKPQDAVTTMTQMLARRLTPPDRSKAFIERANALWAMGRIAGAKGDYESSLAVCPHQGSAYYGLGIAANAEGRDAEAAGRFHQAVRFANKPYVRAWALTALGELAEDDGDFHAAAEYFRRALRENAANQYAASGLHRVTSPARR
jgi:tetratricopeptide (TPR) repeat protein